MGYLVLQPFSMTDVVSIDPKSWLRRRTAQMEAVIRSAAEEVNDPRLSLLSVLNSFEGHEVCSDNEWANGLSLERDDSFHPNSTGHEQLATDLEEMGVLVDDRRPAFEDWLDRKLDGLAPGGVGP